MKLTASVSLDLDNKWSYMKTHGDAGWQSFPSYLDVCVPRILDFLKQRQQNITFFIVGQDAAREENLASLSAIAQAGHEIANHSFNHEPWLHLYSKDEIREEFQKTETAIKNFTDQPLRGFRGPGFSLSPTVLEVLVERGYHYDCSTFPTHLGPLARAYYFFKSPEMSADEKEKRQKLFGKFSDGFQSLKPYAWEIGEHRLPEIPVTTLPFFKTPIHASYVVYLASFSRALAMAYWRMAMMVCKLCGIQPSLLLHPLDFMSATDAPELKFFPGMNVPVDRKLSIMSDIMSIFKSTFNVVSMRDHLAAIDLASLKTRSTTS